MSFTTPSKTVFFFSLSFILGVFFASISILLGLFLTLLFYYFSRNRLVTVFCILFFIIGAFSFHSALYKAPSEIETPFHGVVREEPSVKGNFQRIIIEHEDGGVLLYVDRYADYKYGDILKVEGNFTFPEPEDYANYLKKEGVYHIAFRPQIEKLGNEASLFRKGLSFLREKAEENIRKAVPVPHVYFLEAMLLGNRDSFPKYFNKKLSVSGTRHITAISGMHIVIISGILFYLFLFAGLGKRWAALFSLFFIVLFIFFVGAPASAVRAGIMGGLVLLSYVVYRKTSPFRLIVLAAAVMLSFNPLLLYYDLGFQLSFLAVFGILSLHGPIKNKLQQRNPVYTPRVYTRPRVYKGKTGAMYALGMYTLGVYIGKIGEFFRKKEVVADLLAVTLSAQIFVFPLILYNFGHVSLVSVPANLLIVPLLPLIIPLGFLTAITGLIIFSFPVYILLSFLLFVINFSASLPISAIFVQNVPLFFVFLFYVWLFHKAHTLQKMP